MASRRAKAYMSAYAGGACTQAAMVIIMQYDPAVRLILHDVHCTGNSFRSPIYYGYRAGYYFSRHFGMEAEFLDLKIYADLGRPVLIQGI